MKILLNDEPKEIIEACSLQALVAQLQLKPERLAIELNRQIIRRAVWPTTILQEGDQLEIVHFVGGG